MRLASEDLQILRMAPNAPMPRMARISRHFETPEVGDVPAAVRAEIAGLGVRLPRPGSRIAVAVGSRGISRIAEIVREVVVWLRVAGCEPFIVPAMGSHGGATAEGQTRVLADYGITEAGVAAPVVSSMEVVEVGRVCGGIPAWCNRPAMEADGIVLVNRVKPHTQFRGDIESGLMKLMAIGLGKDRGASTIHAHGIRGLTTVMPEVARAILARAPVLFGLAILENARHTTARVKALLPPDIEEGEKALLLEARRLMATLPAERLDLLILDEMGKDVSGPGMDSVVTGRIMAHGVPDPLTPDVAVLAVLDLTAASHGNAVGLGVADLTTERLVKKVDRSATYINTILGGFPEQGKIPMFFPTDRELLEAASHLIGAKTLAEARVIRARNTLEMEEILVSEPLLSEVLASPGATVLGAPEGMGFDENGLLLPAFGPAAACTGAREC